MKAIIFIMLIALSACGKDKISGNISFSSETNPCKNPVSEQEMKICSAWSKAQQEK